MPRWLWWRVGLVVAVLAASVWFLYPPRQRINLGLDLQGGIHLVLGVQTERALENVTERAAHDLRTKLGEKGVAAQVSRVGATRLLIQVVQAAPEARRQALATVRGVAAELSGFAIERADEAAGQVELGMTPAEADRLRDFAVRQGVETIRNRVDQFGVAEPTIQRQGDDRILVQLPGVQDPARAKELIGKTAVLEFKFLDEQADPEQAVREGPPPGSEVLYGRIVRRDRDTGARTETRIPYVVRKPVLLTGDLLKTAEVRISDSGEPYVSVEFNATGARVFADLTEKNVGRRLAIILDGQVHSAPVIRERIPSGQAQITGGFTPEEARDLAIVLRAGALPAPVQILEERTVGPSLGADSIRRGVISIVASAVAVFAFMAVYYRLSGLIADVALLMDLLVLLACMAFFRATLTLPGIAGIVLTVGIAVDTNILIFERIREELRLGKTVRAAVEQGFRRAFTTVIDTHVTVVVASLILYQFGTGPVRGFAVSLLVGILVSLFTAVFFTRLVFDLVYTGRRRPATLSI